MIEKHLRKFEIKDEDALNKYLELIEKEAPKNGVYTEKHHICPKSMFPDLENSKWNIVELAMEDHIKAHELLVYIFDNGPMKKAYSFITLHDMDERMKYLVSGAYSGDKNPSKRKDVREKIRKSKLGKKRDDLKNKRFFGADEETIEKGLKKMRESRKNIVIVRDKDDNMFGVSIFDERYISGELVPFNKGRKTKPSIVTKEQKERVISTREKTYEKFKKMTFEEFINFLVDEYKRGKNIFSSGVSKKRPFSKNYSGFVKRTNFEQSVVYESVIQRLSNDIER